MLQVILMGSNSMFPVTSMKGQSSNRVKMRLSKGRAQEKKQIKWSFSYFLK